MKTFAILYSINWPNFIVWLPLLEILGNVYCNFCFPGCDNLNFEINLSFLIKSFYHMTKKPGQKLEYLKHKKSFSGELKSFLILKGF